MSDDEDSKLPPLSSDWLTTACKDLIERQKKDRKKKSKMRSFSESDYHGLVTSNVREHEGINEMVSEKLDNPGRLRQRTNSSISLFIAKEKFSEDVVKTERSASYANIANIGVQPTQLKELPNWSSGSSFCMQTEYTKPDPSFSSSYTPADAENSRFVSFDNITYRKRGGRKGKYRTKMSI